MNTGRKITVQWIAILLVAFVVAPLFGKVMIDGIQKPATAPPAFHAGFEAAPVIGALAAYNKDNGRYPDELKQLVPRYLPELPKPQWGTHEWRYKQFENNQYELSVLRYGGYYEGHYYDSRSQSWVYDQ